MKYCFACGAMTSGDPKYCGKCGCTFDCKLCPRQHVNPRGAEVCSACGSKDLSKPQPHIPAGIRLLAIVVRLAIGLLLFYATLSFFVALARSAQVQQFLVASGLLLAVLWGLWSKLPDWIQEAIRDFWITRRHRDDD